jgi:hypothetical protein
MWYQPANRESEFGTRMLVPCISIEMIFAHAPVPKPEALVAHKFMTKCLHLDKYLGPSLDALIKEGLIHDVDDEGNQQLHVFDDEHEFYSRCDKIITGMKDDPTFRIGEDSFEWLEGFDASDAQESEQAWFETLSYADLTKDTRDFTLAIDLALIVGPRSTREVRLQPGSTFRTIVGGSSGGQLTDAIKTFYHSAPQGGTTIAPSFLLQRLPSFLKESQWPRPYKIAHKNWVDYAFDLTWRAMWKRATRQEWAALVHGKLATAIEKYLPTLKTLFLNTLDDPGALVREVQGLGDLVLAGDEGTKLPFWKIEEVEAILKKDHLGLIESERAAGSTTAAIVEKLTDRLRAAQRSAKGAPSESKDEEVRGPKPGQLERALAEPSYARLEAAHTARLQDGATTMVEKLTMIKEGFAEATVLPKAVLFATSGTRLTVYVGAGGTDYLSLLHGVRHLLEVYLGQSLAYDLDSVSEFFWVRPGFCSERRQTSRRQLWFQTGKFLTNFLHHTPHRMPNI